MKGIDVSNYQGVIDFNQVKLAGIEIAYIKASEGLTFNDAYVKVNFDKAKAAGLKVGFYHYLRNNDPISEADHFLTVISGLVPDCIHMIDAEDQSLRDGQASVRVRKFADTLIAKGLKVGIYTDVSFYNTVLDNTVKNLPYWTASWSTQEPSVNHIGWQYSSRGSIPGIAGDVDMDEFKDSIVVTIPNSAPTVDESVRILQHNLNRLFNAGLAEDNILGPLTNRAIYNYGPVLGSTNFNELVSFTSQVLAFPILKIGSRGPAVRYIQYRVGAAMDGDFGPITDSKVRKFQKIKDGIVGPLTWSQIMK